MTTLTPSPLTARLADEMSIADRHLASAVENAQTKTSARDLMDAALSVAEAEEVWAVVNRAEQAAKWADESDAADITATSAVRSELLMSLTESVGDQWSGRSANPIARAKFAARQETVRRLVNTIDILVNAPVWSRS